jgi:hypothetical protein
MKIKTLPLPEIDFQPFSIMKTILWSEFFWLMDEQYTKLKFICMPALSNNFK